MAGREPALLERGGSERGETDDVARRVDVRLLRLVVGVHGEPAAVVGREAGGREIEVGRRPDAADRVEEEVRDDPLAALEQGDGAARAFDVDVGDVLAEAQRAVHVAHGVRERLGDLAVHEVEEARPLVDERHLHAERREHRRVLDADDAGADDDHRAREELEAEDAVGIQDRLAVHGDAGRRRGPRARRDDDLVRLDLGRRR